MKTTTKSERQRLVIEIVKRWETIDINAILREVARALDAEESELKRTVHRDLEELVNCREIEVEHFTRDGALISDYDPAIHKNTKCKWSILKATSGIPGHKLLLNAGANIISTSILKNSIEIGKGKSINSTKGRTFYFSIGNEFLYLRVELDALPFCVHISKPTFPVFQNESEVLQKLFGKRLVQLKLPNPYLSSYKDEKKLGHCLISINEKDKVEVKDLHSSNGTVITHLTKDIAENLIMNGSLMGNQTVMKPWAEDKTVVIQPKKEIRPEKAEAISPPFLLEVSDQFKILVV